MVRAAFPVAGTGSVSLWFPSNEKQESPVWRACASSHRQRSAAVAWLTPTLVNIRRGAVMQQVLIDLCLEGVNVQLCLSFLPSGAHPGPGPGHAHPILPPETKVKSQGFHPSPRYSAGSALGCGTASLLVRAILKFAWLISIPDPSWNLRAGKAESSCCSSARSVQGVGEKNLLSKPDITGGRKERQKATQESLRQTSVLRVGTSFVPGNQPCGATGHPGRSQE